jgi:hypothetical protein
MFRLIGGRYAADSRRYAEGWCSFWLSGHSDWLVPPVPRQQFIQPPCRMIRDTADDVGQRGV